MKILFITDLFPIKPNETTTPVTLYNFVIEWIKQGHSVDVIKPNFIFNSFLRGKPFYKTGFYDFNGVKIFNVNYWTPFLFDIKQKLLKYSKSECLKEKKKGEENISTSSHILQLTSYYDIVIAHMPSGIIFTDKLNINIPLICGVHCSDIEVLKNPLYKFYFKNHLKNAFKKANKIACRSFVLQRKFNKLMPEFATKTFVANSGVNTLSTYGHPVIVHNSPFTILTCANLIKRKNIDKLILAMKDLEGFKLKIIGDGKELKNLQNKVQLNSLEQKVEFLGLLPHEKVLQEMLKAYIFILPSINETFGMVYLEAMASGCITVCTKNDGIDGIIKDGENGFLTEPTIEGIKETLLRIKNFDAVKSASYNLEKIIENSLNTVKEYTPENCAKNYLKNIIN